MVATALDVGRTGTTRFGSSEDDKVEMDALENGGHVEGPHSRSVGQQPPPRLGAQERKPDEHEIGVEEVDEGAVEVIGTANVTDGDDEVMVEEIGDGAEGFVVIDCKAVVVERRERVTVGMMTIVAVDIRTPGDHSISPIGINISARVSQPTSIHSYPGMQQPPPELAGQPVYPLRQPATC